MNTENIFRLASMALTAALVAACSGAPQPIVGQGDDEVEEPAPSGAKLPSGNTKAPGTKTGDKTTTTPPAGTPSTSTPGTTPSQPQQPQQPQPGGQAGQDGQPGRISVNEHCCYGGQYFRCPSSAACFGGFDISACLSTCAGPQDPCFDACFDKLDAAGPPKGCQSMAEPKGVDCANGSINL